MAEACFWGTEELFMLSFSPCPYGGGVRAGKMGRCEGKPAQQIVPALSTVVSSFGYTV